MTTTPSRHVLALLCVGATALALSACAGDDATGGQDEVSADCEPVAEFDTAIDSTLTVAAIQQLPGIDVDVNTGELSGLDSVLLTRFAEENCLELDAQPLPGAAATAAMTEGRADIGGGGWYKTEPRGEILGQSETLWYDQVGIVSMDGLDSIDALDSKRVGVVGGSLFEEPLAETLGSNNVVSYQSIDAIFNDLESGRLDAAMGAGATLTIQVADRGNDDLQVEVLDPDPDHEVLTTPGEPNYPYTKDNEELGAALDDFIVRAKDEGLIRDALAEYGVISEAALEGPEQ
ncbi:substrate-binding periplasmic protein [Nesterenkonia muleiensis]|uniref:substrate-binding periplasmic protein n=1 Tax=Nesterenkonia muleiensis TaxID=2282648 RepID=UPI000E73F77E|nr:transporter substrate-binding domain-containing protein [Nesterenkonia muleiensis]